jgi:hypothetical protein
MLVPSPLYGVDDITVLPFRLPSGALGRGHSDVRFSAAFTAAFASFIMFLKVSCGEVVCDERGATAFGEAGIVHILLAVAKPSLNRADGDWRFFASTLSANFIKKWPFCQG